MREIPEWQTFWSNDPPVVDPFVRDLIATQPMQRLRHVGFLGAIDYLGQSVRGQARPCGHNRFDHSVNVALLALRYACLRGLDLAEKRVLITAALLHDVGHCALSHTLEPVFQRLFGLDHHDASEAVIRGKSPLGCAIPEVLSQYGVDLEEVLGLLDGSHSGPHAFLFNSPMNLDTIEAIARCCLFSATADPVSPIEFVEAIATHDDFPVELGDRFWKVKAEIYRTVILSRRGLLADACARQFMLQTANALQAEDFFLDDAQLRRKVPQLFTLFVSIRERGLDSDLSAEFAVDFDSEIEACARRFDVDTTTAVNTPQDLASRYTQHRRKCRVRLRTLVRQ